MDSVEYSTLSETLRQRRLQLDLPLEEVEKATGVCLKNLKALEAGNYHDLPAAVYIQGYLKSICKLYSLEYSKVIAIYNEEQSLSISKIDDTKLQPTALNDSKIFVTPKTIATGSLSVLFLVVAFYLIQQITHVTAAPILNLEQPAEGQQITQNFIEVTGATEPGTQVTINNQNIPLDQQGKFKQVLYLTLGENQIIVKAANRFNKSTEVKRRIVVAEPPAPQVLGDSDVR